MGDPFWPCVCQSCTVMEMAPHMLDRRMYARTHKRSGDFILCSMLCIALDRQKVNVKLRPENFENRKWLYTVVSRRQLYVMQSAVPLICELPWNVRKACSWVQVNLTLWCLLVNDVCDSLQFAIKLFLSLHPTTHVFISHTSYKLQHLISRRRRKKFDYCCLGRQTMVAMKEITVWAST